MILILYFDDEDDGVRNTPNFDGVSSDIVLLKKNFVKNAKEK